MSSNDQQEQNKSAAPDESNKSRITVPLPYYSDLAYLERQVATDSIEQSDASLLIFSAMETYGPNIRESILLGGLMSQYSGKLCIHSISRKEFEHISTSEFPAPVIENNFLKPFKNTLTLEILAQYDCIFFETFGGLFNGANSDAFGDLLANYVEQCAGGVLCMAVSNDSSYGIGGQFKQRRYHPLTYGQAYNYEKIDSTSTTSNYLGKVLIPDHEVMKNVVHINTGEWCGHTLCPIDTAPSVKEESRAGPVTLIAQWKKTNAPLVATRDIKTNVNAALMIKAFQKQNKYGPMPHTWAHNDKARVITINCGAANKKVQHNYWEVSETDLPILMFNAFMYASRSRKIVRRHLGLVLHANAASRFDKIANVLVETWDCV